MATLVTNASAINGHTDINGSAVAGIVQASSKLKRAGVSLAVEWNIGHWESHAHALDAELNPIDYRTHDIALTGTAKILVEWKKACLNWETVLVADEAGPNATISTSQTKITSTAL